jgi:6-phosphogluconolactonase (cycloisomerase 2 family)
MSSNNRISNLINSQVPFFVRNDHENFVRFLEAYYEWLELPDSENDKEYNVISRIKRVQEFQDIDRTIDDFTEELYKTFLKLIPEETIADKSIILKNVKDFYRSKGSEKSVKFLLRILFGEEETELYYPKKDVLRASDGKWFIEKSVKFTDAKLDGVPITNASDYEKFVGTRIVGEMTGATALVEKIDSYYDGEVLVRELKISNQTRDFFSGEIIRSNGSFDGTQAILSANVFSGIITNIKIDNPGRGYRIGQPVDVISNTGSGAVLLVSSVVESVRDSDITSFFINSNGAGFIANSKINIIDRSGFGANARVSVVDDSGLVHPNTYNVVSSLISLEANTQLSNLTFSNLNSSNANTTLANAFSFITISGLGPIETVEVIDKGNNYTTFPDVSVEANTRLRELGILGSMNIIEGGENYQIGDIIEFENVIGGYGRGARANVRNVDTEASNAISEVGFVQVDGHYIGGSGYSMDKLPFGNVISSTGTGAIIRARSILADGDDLITQSDISGRIQKVLVVKTGSGYLTPPRLDFSKYGDGNATATAAIVTGAYSYPGRWLNDDGQISSYNFLQNRDYYQNFSYVVRTRQSIEKYRKYLKDLIHPSGMKVFGEFLLIDDDSPVANSMKFQGTNTKQYIEYSSRIYGLSDINSNVIPGMIITMNTYGIQENSEVYVQFSSGNVANYNANGIYQVGGIINANSVLVYSGTKISASMNVFNRDSSPTGIHFENNGKIMYMIGEQNDRVNMYDLLYPWDISSAKFRTRSAATLVDSYPTGVTLSSNGKFMYVSGETERTIYQYSLNESWNVNAATLIASFNVSAQDSSPQDVFIGSNGNFMYVVGAANDRIIMYSLASTWNVNTANYVSNISLSTEETSPTSVYFKDDGKIMYVTGTSSARIHQYTLSEAWNIQTYSYTTNTESFTSIESSPQSISISKRGDVVYFIGSTNDIIVQAPLREAWNISSIILDRFDTESANSGNVTVAKNIN